MLIMTSAVFARWTDHLRQAALNSYAMHPARGACLAALCLCLAAAPARADCTDPRHWVDYVDPDFGIRIALPIDCFFLQEGGQSGTGHLFLSGDGRARLAVYASESVPAHNAAGLKSWLVEEVGGYEDVTYSPMGESWLVLSGYRGDDIFYEKYMFSQGGRLMSSFWLTFPRQQKLVFDPIIGRMEDSFRPGDGG